MDGFRTIFVGNFLTFLTPNQFLDVSMSLVNKKEESFLHNSQCDLMGRLFVNIRLFLTEKMCPTA